MRRHKLDSSSSDIDVSNRPDEYVDPTNMDNNHVNPRSTKAKMSTRHTRNQSKGNTLQLSSNGLLEAEAMNDFSNSLYKSFASPPRQESRSNTTVLPNIRHVSPPKKLLSSVEFMRSNTDSNGLPTKLPPPPPLPTQFHPGGRPINKSLYHSPNSNSDSNSNSNSPNTQRLSTSPSDFSKKLGNFTRKFKKASNGMIDQKLIGSPIPFQSFNSNSENSNTTLNYNYPSHKNNDIYSRIPNNSGSGFTDDFTATTDDQTPMMTNKKSNTSALLAKLCLFCEEPLKHVLGTLDDPNTEPETIFDLRCGCYTHEKCLLISMEFAEDITINNKESHFPHCPKCGNEVRAVPTNENIMNSMIAKNILPISTLTSTSSRNTSTSSPNSLSGSSNSSPSLQQRRQKRIDLLTIDLSRSANVNNPSAHQQQSMFPPDSYYSHHKKKSSRGSSISAISSIISSVTRSPLTSTSAKFNIVSPDTNEFAMNFQRQKYITELLDIISFLKFTYDGSNDASEDDESEEENDDDFEDFSTGAVRIVTSEEQSNINNKDVQTFAIDLRVINSFGVLRLFDKLLVSKNSKKWREIYCYLFSSMILFVDLSSRRLKLVPINHGSKFSVISSKVICFSNNDSTSNENVYLSSNTSETLEKWGIALNNTFTELPYKMITSTVKDDEFDGLLIQANKQKELLGKNEGAETIQSRKIPDGVDPRLYEATLIGLDIKKKPASMIFILNQRSSSSYSLLTIQNIIRSLLLVKIDILIIFASTESLSLNSKIVGKSEIKKGFKDEELHEFLKSIEDYHNELAVSTPMVERRDSFLYTPTSLKTISFDFSDDRSTNDSLNEESEDENSLKLKSVVTSFLEQSKIPLADITSVVLSSSPVINIKDLPTLQNILLEISSVPQIPSYYNGDGRHSNLSTLPQDTNNTVISLTTWEDAMEAICNTIGLEFDDSDFESSSDDDGEDKSSDEEEEEEEEKEEEAIGEDVEQVVTPKDDGVSAVLPTSQVNTPVAPLNIETPLTRDDTEFSTVTTRRKNSNWKEIYDDIEKTLDEALTLSYKDN